MLTRSGHPLANDLAERIRDAAAALAPRLVSLRCDIHSHPELGFEETRTAGIVAAELARLGIPHRTGLGRTGVVGTIEGGRPGPTLAIRADMDALPIQEETGLPFASTAPGKMHACGHDIHTATLLGVAAVLKGLAPRLAGRVALVFQPAVELLGGAAAMIADGAAEGLDLALGFHNQPDMPVGRFGYVRGATFAAADRFDLVVRGRSGHAAHPHAAVDPIVAAAFVSGAQTVVSREIDPLQPAVVTIGQFQGGATHNIIPERVHLKGTVRTLRQASRDTAEAALRRLVAGLETGMRVSCALDYGRLVPALVNDDRALDPLVANVRRRFGDEAVSEGEPVMGAEDFAEFAALVPSAHLRAGSGAPGRGDRLHNADHHPDERCIGLGVQALSRAALDMLA